MSDEIESVAISRLSGRRRVPLQNALGLIAAAMSGDVKLIDGAGDPATWPRLQEAWVLLLRTVAETDSPIQLYGLPRGEEALGEIPAIHPDQLDGPWAWKPGTNDLTDEGIVPHTPVSQRPPLAGYPFDRTKYPGSVSWVDVEYDEAFAYLRPAGLQRVRVDARQLLSFILALEKPKSKAGRDAAEFRCREWLVAMMTKHPEKTNRLKESYLEEARRLFKVGRKVFDRAWKAALAATGAKWDDPGPKRRSSR